MGPYVSYGTSDLDINFVLLSSYILPFSFGAGLLLVKSISDKWAYFKNYKNNIFRKRSLKDKPKKKDYKDKATLPTPGGIDMNEIPVDKKGEGVNIQFDPAQLNSLQNMHIDGFAPVIINITPINNVPFLLGLANQLESFEVSNL